jgi:hypothetical protein
MVGLYRSGSTGIQIGTRGSAQQIDVWNWGGTVQISSTGYTPPPATWIHIGYTWDSTTHSLYVNGVLNNTSTASVTAGVLNLVYINGYPTGGTAEVSATQVDDVLYYNRTLSAAEVQTIATCRGFRDGIFYGLIARYSFNELPPGGTLASVVDYSGNGNTLIPQGAGTAVTYIPGVIDLDDRPVLG